jgi:hypothetical protein
MSEITAESVQDRLAKLDSAATERVAWIIEQIADAGHTVSPPGLPWAGQEAIIAATMAQYDLERPAAEDAVELARLDLWHGNSGASGHVERKLLVARLNVIRRIILQAVREPKKTLTYVFKRKRNPKTGEVTMVRVPRREQVKEGFDVNAVRLLIDKDVLKHAYVVCHPCVNTSSLRVSLDDMMNRFLPYTGHVPTVVEL